MIRRLAKISAVFAALTALFQPLVPCNLAHWQKPLLTRDANQCCIFKRYQMDTCPMESVVGSWLGNLFKKRCGPEDTSAVCVRKRAADFAELNALLKKEDSLLRTEKFCTVAEPDWWSTLKQMMAIATPLLPFWAPRLMQPYRVAKQVVSGLALAPQIYATCEDLARTEQTMAELMKDMKWLKIAVALLALCVNLTFQIACLSKINPIDAEPNSDQAGQAAGGSLVNNTIIVNGQDDHRSMEDIKKALARQSELLETCAEELKAQQKKTELLQSMLYNMCAILHFKPRVFDRDWANGLTHHIQLGRDNADSHANVHDIVMDFFDEQDHPDLNPELRQRAAIIMAMMNEGHILQDSAFRQRMPPHLVCNVNGMVQFNDTSVMFALQVAEEAENSPEVITALETFRDSQLALTAPPARPAECCDFTLD